MNETAASEESKTERFGFAQMVATVGLASASIAFLATLSSWCFARGLTTSTGIPPQVAGFKSSIDSFSSMAFQYVFGFGIALGVGFLPSGYQRAKPSKHIFISIGLGILTLIIAEVNSFRETHSSLYSGPLLLAALLSPLLIGYSFQALKGAGPIRYAIVCGVTLVAMDAFAQHLYQFGFDKGAEVSADSSSKSPGTDYGISAIKFSDFPLVTVRTKQLLVTRIPASKDGDVFTYASVGSSRFFRLILQDDANYYLIENFDGSVQSMAVRKDSVIQMLYLKSPPKSVGPTDQPPHL